MNPFGHENFFTEKYFTTADYWLPSWIVFSLSFISSITKKISYNWVSSSKIKISSVPDSLEKQITSHHSLHTSFSIPSWKKFWRRELMQITSENNNISTMRCGRSSLVSIVSVMCEFFVWIYDFNMDLHIIFFVWSV